jgi:hypothetical protein
MERLYPADVLSKRERIERTLNLQPVDRSKIRFQEPLIWTLTRHRAQ